MADSPFAAAGASLASLGYHPIPIIPEAKAPGAWFVGKGWRAMSDWGRFKSRPPTEYEMEAWAGWTDANVGIMLGTVRGDGCRLLAVDIDTDDLDDIETIEGCLPRSPMVKVGAKGRTLFFVTDASPSNIAYKRPVSEGGVLVGFADLLVGDAPKQTVAPPSIHPDGHTYRWTAGPVAIDDLPVLDADALEALGETMEMLGWAPEGRSLPYLDPAKLVTTGDGDGYWREINDTALANLDTWVPALGLPKARKCAGGGWRAVNPYRSSASGRPVADRSCNLGINPGGIEDFGAGQKMTAIDLVAMGMGGRVDEAADWLRDKLGLASPDGGYVVPMGPVIEAVAASMTDEGGAGAMAALPTSAEVGGLVGRIADFILSASRRPQPDLALGAALAMVATLAGRRWLSPTGCGLNLYVLGIAPSGAGKDTPLSACGALFRAADLGHLIGAGEITSQTALLGSLRGKPVQLAAMDEFGSFLRRIMGKRASAYERGITKSYRELWNRSADAMPGMGRAGESAESMIAPHYCLFGVSTPDEFYAALGEGDVENGTLARFLAFQSGDAPVREGEPVRLRSVPPELAYSMSALWASGSPPGTDMRGLADWTDALDHLVEAEWASPAVRQLWIDCAERYRVRCQEGGVEDAIFSRRAETAVRIATLIAIGRCDVPAGEVPVIGAEEWVLGDRIAEHCFLGLYAEAHGRVSETEFQEVVAKIRGKIVRRAKRQGGVVTMRELQRDLRSAYKVKLIKEVLEALQDAEEIGMTQAVQEGGGRPVVTIHCAT